MPESRLVRKDRFPAFSAIYAIARGEPGKTSYASDVQELHTGALALA
jgi:hypothetical protein